MMRRGNPARAKVEIDALTTRAAKPASKHAKLCKDSHDSLSDESLVIGPVSPDITDTKEECHFVSQHAKFKVQMNHQSLDLSHQMLQA